jgi:hypothetical protein
MNHTIPDSLVRYQHELEEAIRRDITASAANRRRRRVWLRIGLASGATAAVALGALSLFVSGAPSTVAPAAAAVIRHAAAALAETPGTILHIKMIATQDNGNGTTVSWTQESYDEQRPPFDSRLVNVELPGTPPGVEQATADGVSQVYDPTSDTIYIGPPPSHANPDTSNTTRQHYMFRRGPTPGTYRVRVPIKFIVAGKGRSNPATDAHVRTIWHTTIVTAAQARALRNGADIIRPTFRGRGLKIANLRVVQAPRTSSRSDPADVDPFSAAFRGQILDLLRSGQAQVLGHATVDGRDTLEIQSTDGHITYYVAPDTYVPVELSTRGTSGGVVLRFEIYEDLSLNDNSALLSLTAQHPTASVDRNVADYNAAETRLFPRG